MTARPRRNIDLSLSSAPSQRLSPSRREALQQLVRWLERHSSVAMPDGAARREALQQLVGWLERHTSVAMPGEVARRQGLAAGAALHGALPAARQRGERLDQLKSEITILLLKDRAGCTMP